jgi:hypothetical protein
MARNVVVGRRCRARRSTSARADYAHQKHPRDCVDRFWNWRDHVKRHTKPSLHGAGLGLLGELGCNCGWSRGGDPLRETLDEFLDRARQHYRETKTFYEQHGFTRAPVKREVDHFRYLAAHLVGGYSWAQLADGDTPLNLPVKSEKTIAGEARKAAALIRLSLRPVPGPRPGSPRRPSAKRGRT